MMLAGDTVKLAITPRDAEAGEDAMEVEGDADADDAASSVVSDMSDDVLTSHAQIRSMIDNMDADDEPLIR